MFGARRAACSVFWARAPCLVAVVVIDVDRAVGVERRDTARPVVGALVKARLDFVADLELAALVGIVCLVGRALRDRVPVKCCLSTRRKIVRCCVPKIFVKCCLSARRKIVRDPKILARASRRLGVFGRPTTHLVVRAVVHAGLEAVGQHALQGLPTSARASAA